MLRTGVGTFIVETKTHGLESSFGAKRKVPKPDERKRRRSVDPASESYAGPWALFEGDDNNISVSSDKQKNDIENAGAGPNATFISSVTSFPDVIREASCIYHGNKTVDWQGNSWLMKAALSSTRVQSSDVSFRLPSKNTFTWEGHSKGVQAVALFPANGTLILSGSMDSTIKIWDFFDDRKCKMTYTGHSSGVRDVKFAPDGRKFYSSSFDTSVHQWDTETGKILTTFSNKSINHSIAVHPYDEKSILLANHNKKVLQFDASSGKVCLEYNEHLGPVSAVSFCEDGKKFITSSDDRKIFVWNWGIPVVDKYVSSSQAHAVPAVSVHPSGSSFACQSMSNSIVVYQAFGEYRSQSNKKFFGHSNMGYAIQPGFSPDGKFLMSGSSDGQLFFWDWKSCKMYRKLKAHQGVCMGSLWHPSTASQILSWGWDGSIKLWE